MREKTLKGSLTVEAAWIMAMVLLSIAVMLQQAGRIHDETKIGRASCRERVLRLV